MQLSMNIPALSIVTVLNTIDYQFVPGNYSNVFILPYYNILNKI